MRLFRFLRLAVLGRVPGPTFLTTSAKGFFFAYPILDVNLAGGSSQIHVINGTASNITEKVHLHSDTLIQYDILG